MPGKRDKVTIALYSTQQKDGTYNKVLFGEKQNIEKIQTELTQAARAAGREPPEFVVSVLLIPDWSKPNNSYDDGDYKKLQSEFMTEARKHFEKEGVTVQDFYKNGGDNNGELSTGEKNYLHGLKAKGSTIDIMKMRAVINNQDCSHLQLDSNTLISDFGEFYTQTFAAQQQQDALNACCYSDDNSFVSVHSKVIYTPQKPNSRVVEQLETGYRNFYGRFSTREGFGKGFKFDTRHEASNVVYSTMFVRAMQSAGLASSSQDTPKLYKVYPAKIEHPAFRITKNIITKITESWNTPKKEDPVEASLKAIPGVEIQVGTNKILCDYLAFQHIIRKYALKDVAAREKLLEISDTKVEAEIVWRFYNKISIEHPEYIEKIAEMIPDNPEGNFLTAVLYDMSVQELLKSPQRYKKKEDILGKKCSYTK